MISSAKLCIATLALSLSLVGCGPSIHFDRRDQSFSASHVPSVAVVGSESDSPESDENSLLKVFVLSDGEPVPPALAGSYDYFAGRLEFQPAFPLSEGLSYRAVLRLDGEVTLDVAIPKTERKPSAFVEAVYPSGDVLPENLLKFYVHFSAPMSHGQAWKNIRLERDGKEVELAFLEIDEELWDRDQRRLTVLIDPGRIKREVKPLEDVGPALESGHVYKLVVDSSWEDAEGTPLVRKWERSFRVSPADRTVPDPKKWKVTAPPAGTRAPLKVELDESLDHALLHSQIGVGDASLRAMDGEVEILDTERTWTFTPDGTWSAGIHTLVIGTTLEDLAGNSVGKLFEVDATRAVETHIGYDVETIVFRVE